MAQIPEDLLQQFMQMTGMSRQEAEKALAKSISEMIHGPAFKDQLPEQRVKRGEKTKYDRWDYPHFLPSDDVMKYTIRVSLKGAPLPIWRKFECPSNISLRYLTELIMQLMGWYNVHLNQIAVPDGDIYVPCYQYDKENDWGTTVFQEDYMLSDIIFVKGTSVEWEYDFGDSWRHHIRLSAIDDYFDDDDPCEIVFLSGKGECPPEDCGGVHGYQEILELHKKLKSRKRLTSEEKERLDWYGIDKDFDPSYCDLDFCMEICDEFNEREETWKAMDDSKKPNPAGPHIDSKPRKELAASSPLYDDVLSLAFQIRDIEPWEDLNDSDNYAIRMSDGSEIYVATMGNGGESYDVQFYDGKESFQTYIALLKYASSPDFEILEAHKWLDYKTIMFQEPGDGVMLPAQYKKVEAWAKSHNVKIADEHGYPFPQKFRPHLYPTMQMSDDELARLKEALEAAVWFCQLIMDTDDLTDLGFSKYREYPSAKGGKVVPLVVKTQDGYKVERTKLPGGATQYETPALPESEYLALRFLPKKGAQYCRLIHIPSYMGDQSEPENGRSVLTFMCVDKKDQDVSMSRIYDLKDSFERDVIRHFIEKAKQEYKIPQRIITDDLRTAAFLRDFCKHLGIILEFKSTRIPVLTTVCQHMYDSINHYDGNGV